MSGLLSGLRRAMPPPENIAGARGMFDGLPAVMEAIGRLPTIIREMPGAPVIAAAASRLVADAIGAELKRRGPSPAFVAICSDLSLDEAAARDLHLALVTEIGQSPG